MSASREGKRRVLFMAYDFPPGGARGTKRIVKFLKYLPDFGWEPIVLTARNPNYDFHDGSLLSELPAVLEVHKARTLESLIYSHRYGAGDVADALAVKLAQERRGVLRKLVLQRYLGR